jgi:hypothetical protein
MAAISSLLFGIGSIAFARAFREPAVPPCVDKYNAILNALHHIIYRRSNENGSVSIIDDSKINIDEFIASVFFFFGSVFLIPGTIFLVYYSWQFHHTFSTKAVLYLLALLGVLCMSYAAYWFAAHCGELPDITDYPEQVDTDRRHQCFNCLEDKIGVHIQNEWLIGLWVLLLTSIVTTMWSFVLLLSALNPYEIDYRTIIFALR